MKAWFVDLGEGSDMGVPYDEVYIIYASTRGRAKSLAWAAREPEGLVEFTGIRAYRIPGEFSEPEGRADDRDPLWESDLVPTLPRRREAVRV